MIKLIVKPDRVFYHMCSRCGALFSYEFEDVKDGGVECPCCKKKCLVDFGDDNEGGSNIPGYTPDETPKVIRPYWWDHPIEFIPCDNSNPCSRCDWGKKHRNEIYVGDTPCQWCQHSPYRVTCSDPTKIDTSLTSISSTPNGLTTATNTSTNIDREALKTLRKCVNCKSKK